MPLLIILTISGIGTVFAGPLVGAVLFVGCLIAVVAA